MKLSNNKENIINSKASRFADLQFASSGFLTSTAEYFDKLSNHRLSTQLPGIKILLLFLITCLVQNSCSLDFPPEDQVSDPDAIRSVTEAKMALSGAYISYDDYTYALDLVLLSDDMKPTSLLAGNPGLKNTYLWLETALVPLANDIWQKNYNTIARVNVLLERLPNVITVTEQEKTELSVLEYQAKYLKALCYFQLLKFFSPAFSQYGVEEFGILLKKNFSLTTQQQRISLSDSVEAIYKLLEKKESKNENNNLYLNNDAANYLSAELALWSGDYKKTLDFALPLYEKYKILLTQEQISAIYSNEDSKLRLFAVDISHYDTKLYVELKYDHVGDEDNGDYLMVNPDISYSVSDTRYGLYSIPFTINEKASSSKKEIFLLGKYNRRAKSKELLNYYTKFRVAGIFFICAEAYLKSGEKQKAVDIINELLRARNSKTISYTEDSDLLLTQLLFEKQKEFVGEPERFFDLKRNRKTIKRFTSLSSYTIGADDYKWTFPIPLSEIRYNKKIKQNKGWEHINIKN